jgi:hypothetical protein
MSARQGKGAEKVANSVNNGKAVKVHYNTQPFDC